MAAARRTAIFCIVHGEMAVTSASRVNLAAAAQPGPAQRSGARRRLWLAGGAIALLTMLAHAPAIPGDFQWDDSYWIWENPVLEAGQAPWGYWCAPPTRSLDYLPITSTFLYLQRQLWGVHPQANAQHPYPAMPYRAVNVALHAAAAVLVWRVLTAVAVPGAWLGAILFAVHPVTAASAGWVSETKNTLSLIFYALALLAYLRFDATGRWRTYAAAVVAMALSLLTKQSVAVLPAVLTVLLCWRRRWLTDTRPSWVPRKVGPLAGLFLLAAASAVVTVQFHHHAEIAHVNIGPPEGLFQRLLIAARALWFYAFKAIAPVNLMMVYPKWDPARLDWTVVAIPALLAWGAMLMALRRRPWARSAAGVTACFAVSLAPVLGFVNMSFMRFSFVSDHLAYLALPVPMAAAGAAAALLMRRGRRWRLAVPALAAMAVLLLAALTARRAHTFATSYRLWEDNVRRNGDAWIAQCLLGRAMIEKGQSDQAVPHLLRALELKPDYTEARLNLAAAYANLGNESSRRGDGQQAARHYDEALRLAPDTTEVRCLMGQLLTQLGRPAEALVHLEQVQRERPDWPGLHSYLGQALAGMGRHAEAAGQLRQAIAQQGAAALPMYHLAWLLATTDDDALRDGAEALRLTEQASRLGQTDPVPLHMTFSAAYAELGRFDEALDAAGSALEHARSRGRQDSAAELEALIPFYQRHQTYRDFLHRRP